MSRNVYFDTLGQLISTVSCRLQAGQLVEQVIIDNARLGIGQQLRAHQVVQ